MPVQGNFELRAAVSKFHKELDGIDADPNYTLIAPGSKVLIYNVFKSLQKCDVFY